MADWICCAWRSGATQLECFFLEDGEFFAQPVTFNRALTMEWLNAGQRVQKYSIEIWTGTGWSAVAGAEAIGHKKIDVFAPVTASRVRLNILSSSDAAAIREFQLYRVEDNVGPK